MIRREVVFSPEANADLLALYDWIAEQASPKVALGYIDRLEDYVRVFDIASERGILRDEIREGLRTIGFERRVTIAFNVKDDQVIILGLFYGGQNWQTILSGLRLIQSQKAMAVASATPERKLAASLS